MKKSFSLNAILNILKTSLGMIFPLVTFPYVSRILLVENVGKVNYAMSIISYFSLIAALGIQIYAIREGSRLRENKNELNRFVSEVYSINVITSVFAYILLSILILFTDMFNSYHNLLWIMSLIIPLTLIGSDWINSIFEDYLYITIRTIVFQLISLFMIFLLVKEQSDYTWYALCIVISSAGSGLVNYFYTKKYCNKQFIFNNNFRKHMIPILVLFSTSVASTLYSSADITMLGIMINDYSVGIYSTAGKVYNIFKQILFAIVVVGLPRFSYMFAKKTKDQYEKMANNICDILVILAVPLVAGMVILSGNIVNVLAGKEYGDATLTLQIKSFAILFAIFAYFFMQLVLLPAKKESLIMKATIFVGIINILVNIVLIPRFQENGAAFTSVISEALICIIVLFISRKIVNVKFNITNLWQSILSTGCMVVVLQLSVHFIDNDILCLILSFLGGCAVYLLALFIFRNIYIVKFIRTLLRSTDRSISQ
jgi:O-antigen/teichoic acid export membrane protein